MTKIDRKYKENLRLEARTKESKLKINERLKKLKDSPEECCLEKIAELESTIMKMPNKKVKNAGNKTIKEHLIELKNSIESNPNAFITKEKVNLEKALERSEKRKQRMAEKLNEIKY